MNGEAGPAPGRPACVSWLILAYRLPARPGLKATIRRRLAATGAVYLANAVAAAPVSPAAERAFRRLRSMIGEAGGSAQVLRAAAMDGGATWSGSSTRRGSGNTPRSSPGAATSWPPSRTRPPRAGSATPICAKRTPH